jgi:hypothetical protein
MNTQAIKKWEGALSLVWVALGLVVFMCRGDHLNFDSFCVMFLAVFVAWWGVALVFAVSGLCSGSRVSALAGLVTILAFLYFLCWALIPRIQT